MDLLGLLLTRRPALLRAAAVFLLAGLFSLGGKRKGPPSGSDGGR